MAKKEGRKAPASLKPVGGLEEPGVAFTPLQGGFRPLGELLRQARGKVALVEAAARLGISKNTLNDYELMKREPDLKFIKLFAETFHTPATPLLQALLRLTWPEGSALHGRFAGDDELEVPVYDVVFSSGNGGAHYEEHIIERIPVPRRLLLAWGIPIGMAAFVKNSGDSMEPLLGDTDLVLLDRSVDNVVVSDMIYAFRLNEELRIKRIRKLPGGGIELRSDNERYPAEKWPGPNLYDFKVLGRVRTVWRKLP